MWGSVCTSACRGVRSSSPPCQGGSRGFESRQVRETSKGANSGVHMHSRARPILGIPKTFPPDLITGAQGCSSVGQSVRLIIARSAVQSRPPLLMHAVYVCPRCVSARKTASLAGKSASSWCALVAQLAERFPRKEEAAGSTPVEGSTHHRRMEEIDRPPHLRGQVVHTVPQSLASRSEVSGLRRDPGGSGTIRTRRPGGTRCVRHRAPRGLPERHDPGRRGIVSTETLFL